MATAHRENVLSLFKTDVSSLTDKHTLDWQNPSLAWNLSSSECPQISVAQTDGQFQLKKTNKHSSISRNLTLVWPLSPAHLQLLWMKCKQRSTHLTESALPSFTYTANGYDTDTTAGALCLQEKSGQGGFHHWTDTATVTDTPITVARNDKCGDSTRLSRRWARVEDTDDGRGESGWKAKVPKLIWLVTLVSTTCMIWSDRTAATINSSLDTMKIRCGQSSKNGAD